MKLDKFDREILRVLQQGATVSMADLSQRGIVAHSVLETCQTNGSRWHYSGKVTLLNSKA